MTDSEYLAIDTVLYRLAYYAPTDIENECWRSIRLAFNEAYGE